MHKFIELLFFDFILPAMLAITLIGMGILIWGAIADMLRKDGAS